jgi:coproporphyrinogen III oxidase-like Fe-S oxidoreductase
MQTPQEVNLQTLDRVAEFAMNTLRLKSGVPLTLFTQTTGADVDQLIAAADVAISRGWLEAPIGGQFVTTPLGYRFLDSVVATFV